MDAPLDISALLDKPDSQYAYFEHGWVDVTVKNVSGNVVDVVAANVIFTQGNRQVQEFSVDCNLQISAGEIKNIRICFAVGAWANAGINVFDIRIEYGKTVPRHSGEMWLERGAGRIAVLKSESNGKRVFVSHSNAPVDASVVERIRRKLSAMGFEPYIAEDDPKAGDNLWKKILCGIDSSDLVIVLWTEKGAESCDVREEVGMAVALKKKLVPVVETDPAGSLQGLEYVPLDRKDLKKSIVTVAERIVYLQQRA